MDLQCFSLSAINFTRCRWSVSVERLHVARRGTQVDADRPCIHFHGPVRPRREVAGRAIGGLQPDLPGPVQLRGVGVQGPFALPVVEDAGRLFLLPRRLAPVAGAQFSVFLPRAPGHLQGAVAVPSNPQQAHHRRLSLAALREGELPPQALDVGEASLVLDRLLQLLADDANLRGGRLSVAYRGQAEEIGRQLRASGVEDEGSAHPEHAAEEPGLEDDVVPRRGLTGVGGGGRGRVDGRPVVLREDECGEVDLVRELDEPLERRRPGIEGGRPGIDVRAILEAARQRLDQLGLLAGRAEKDSRLFHRTGQFWLAVIIQCLTSASSTGRLLERRDRGFVGIAVLGHPARAGEQLAVGTHVAEREGSRRRPLLGRVANRGLVDMACSARRPHPAQSARRSRECQGRHQRRGRARPPGGDRRSRESSRSSEAWSGAPGFRG